MISFSPIKAITMENPDVGYLSIKGDNPYF
jgi:hypothetical protein